MSAAPIAVNPYVGQDFYVPSFRILIRAKEVISVENDIINLSYTDTLQDFTDSFTLTVNNWDPDGGPTSDGKGKQGAFKYSDKETFNPWQDVELFMGYYRNGKDERRRMLVGEITTMVPSFPASGPSTLSVTAQNLFNRFRVQQATKLFTNKKDTEIAQIIVEDVGKALKQNVTQITLKMDDEEVAKNLKREIPLPSLEMHNQFPLVFLLQRARSIGYDLWLEPTGTPQQRTVIFHYQPTADVARPTYILEWGKTLISFQPRLQTANQASELTVRGWDPQKKEPIEGKATRDGLTKKNLGAVAPADVMLPENGLSQKTEIVVNRPIQSKEEADQLAERKLLQLSQGLVEGSGKTVGLPDLRAGSKIEVRGLGQRFSGTYLVTGTTHSMGDGGYTTDFTARMEPRSK